MPVVSVDLAYKSYVDIGVVVMSAGSGRVTAQPVWLAERGLRGRPTVSTLVKHLTELAEEADARWIVVDGPQGWKAPDNGLEHARVCESQCATPGKTGLPGTCKPSNYIDYISFSIELFDALAERGWPRLPSAVLPEAGSRHALESFPTRAWRCLGLRALPGKAATTQQQLRDHLGQLRRVVPLDIADDITHDDLQAAVAGLAGIAFDSNNAHGVFVAGLPPVELEGSWREGFIVNPSTTAAA